MKSPLSIELEVVTVRALIDHMATRRGDETFLVSPDTTRRLTFGELQQRSIDLARRLRGMGLSLGDKVACLLDNGLFTAELFLGSMYGGFVPVPLNVGAGPSQLEYTLRHCDARVAFTSDDYQELLHRAAGPAHQHFSMIPTHADHGPDWTGKQSPSGELPAVDPEDDALLVYTSGSTGQPKGVIVSHRSVIAGGWNTVHAHQLSPRDRSLCVLPLYHMNAQIVTLMSTLLSGGSVIMPRRFDAHSFWKLAAQYRCSWFALVPTIISQLLHWTDPVDGCEGAGLEQVRFARSSSAPLAPSQHEAFERKFKLLLIEAMGSTEAGGAILSNPLPPGERKVGSPGIPYGFDVKVVDAVGQELPRGQAGEIILRGPSAMRGYYKDPGATAAVIGPDGWLRTGDLGYQDEDGYFWIVGRVKELILKGGENIAPREIDEVLARHPAIVEAAALGVPDPYLGEEIVAYVVLKPGESCTAPELIDFCTRELGHFKAPSKIYFAEELPKGPSGKVQRLRLAERTEKDALAMVLSVCANRPVGAPETPMPQGASAAPRTPVEEILAEIWAEVLGLEQVSPHDSFFALGGHSLLAARVASRIRDVFQIELSLGALFEAPTVSGLALVVAQALAAEAGPEEMARLWGELEGLSKPEGGGQSADAGPQIGGQKR